MKLARKVTGRTNVIAFRGGFHGASLGSLAATTSPLLRGGAGIALSGVTILPYGSTGGPSVVDALERELRAAGPVPPPAAILLETVQGEGGLFVAAATWLAEVRRIADRIGARVIVDDIQAGCGRTGTFFSFEHVPDFQPDLVCLSKSLSGMGLPMAALLIRRDHDVWAPGEHNGTFRGHNLAFVGGTAALDYWADASFVGHVTELAAIIESDIAELAGQLPTGTAVPVGRGSWSGLRFADAELAGQVREELFEARIIAETCGRGRVLKLMPPLTITRAEWSAVIGRLSEVVLDTSRRSQPGDYLDLRVPA
jgi:diaminobutyrate-2-oxoglutarate transaminase